jgi:hypothetical protein
VREGVREAAATSAVFGTIRNPVKARRKAKRNRFKHGLNQQLTHAANRNVSPFRQPTPQKNDQEPEP